MHYSLKWNISINIIYVSVNCVNLALGGRGKFKKKKKQHSINLSVNLLIFVGGDIEKKNNNFNMDDNYHIITILRLSYFCQKVFRFRSNCVIEGFVPSWKSIVYRYQIHVKAIMIVMFLSLHVLEGSDNNHHFYTS